MCYPLGRIPDYKFKYIKQEEKNNIVRSQNKILLSIKNGKKISKKNKKKLQA